MSKLARSTLLALCCAMLLPAALPAGSGVLRPSDGGIGPGQPPESLLGRPWEYVGHAQRYEVYIDPSAIASDDGKVGVWLLLSFAYRAPPEWEWTAGSIMRRVRIDCTGLSSQLDEEHAFSQPMGGGCYLGGMGSFWDGRGLRRRHPPGWSEEILPRTPEALAASRVCGQP